MPRRDGTGPLGEGTLSGRGCGPCGGEFLRAGAACRRGNRGQNYRGQNYRGHDYRGRGFYNDAPERKEVLQAQKDELQSQLAAIERQIDSL